MPVMVTGSPTIPDVTDRAVIVGVGKTVKLFPLLSTPLAWTTTLPVVAPGGTGTCIVVAFQLVGLPAVPLNFTVLLPCDEPKLLPETVTEVPTADEVGERLDMLGAETTVKLLPLLAVPETVTTTLPVVALVGTVATMLVELQLVAVAAFPLNLTVLEPWLDPKFVPVIVTEAPRAPEVGERLVMLGPAAWSWPARGKKTRTNARISNKIQSFLLISTLSLAVYGVANPESARSISWN
ncbi:MAG: hypothetical protein WA875_01660 [Candidatus Acidiferrales bacterium]